jgi:hypothetical protein
MSRPIIRSCRTGRVICSCGRGYGSEYDGLCTSCRGYSAWEAKQRHEASTFSEASWNNLTAKVKGKL